MIRSEPLRNAIGALLLLSIAGVILELLLLEHTESTLQWVPIVLLAIGLVHAAVAALRPARPVLLSLRLTMAAFVVAGALGLYLHYRGNVQFELEMQPGLAGSRLIRRALQGATPALAPGVMLQLGLLGLLFTWRHPALVRRSPDA